MNHLEEKERKMNLSGSSNQYKNQLKNYSGKILSYSKNGKNGSEQNNYDLKKKDQSKPKKNHLDDDGLNNQQKFPTYPFHYSCNWNDFLQNRNNRKQNAKHLQLSLNDEDNKTLEQFQHNNSHDCQQNHQNYQNYQDHYKDNNYYQFP